jgi:hypothetical protein
MDKSLHGRTHPDLEKELERSWKAQLWYHAPWLKKKQRKQRRLHLGAAQNAENNHQKRHPMMPEKRKWKTLCYMLCS